MSLFRPAIAVSGGARTIFAMREMWPDPDFRMDHKRQRTHVKCVMRAAFMSQSAFGTSLGANFKEKNSRNHNRTLAPMRGVLLFSPRSVKPWREINSRTTPHAGLCSRLYPSWLPLWSFFGLDAIGEGEIAVRCGHFYIARWKCAFY
ncbi:hypothetical protein [Allorhizobium taibaishanense]|uniref:Uncharacterized protein n=1 Tax=Allorhizobium taibaishanense TaxID=887144 RepID=A0A7W6HM39_9HYPH|nr:hypothetical protein [Allorhizobium taibaishanense]MBB4007688.1 hypothetical protein [Allorhizobium taibaishanense]